MYVPFFGLTREPFSIAPDPRFLFMSERHREALAHLLYGVGGGGGFVLLTGEIGAGKTTVCRCFLEQIPPHCAVAYIFNPRLTVAELLQTVCDEFGIAVPPRPPGETGVKAGVDALNAFLLRAHAEGRSAVLVIDEAQSLAPDVLEQLRLLTNLETAERKLLQIILIGQPELREMLARPDMEQLAQRVIARYHLGPLSREETEPYIRHRLAVAGAQARMPFEPAALASIHRLTGGVPRRINLLADRALLGAYAQQRAQVDKRTVEQAAREVFARPTDGAGPLRSPRSGVALAGAALVGVALAGALWAWWLQRPPAPAPLVAAPAASSPAAVAASAQAPPAASVAEGVVAIASRSLAGGPAAAAARPVDVAMPSAAEADAPASADPAAVLAAAHTEVGIAWRELALRWNVAIGEGDACVAAAQARLICLPRTGGGLPVVRQLDRPGIVTLRAGNGRPGWALLVALREDEVTLQAGAQRFRLTLPALATVWRGEFATFWRAPAGWREGASAAADPALRNWVAQQLDAAGVAAGTPLPERVRMFQLAQGLPPDGVTGPLTLMLLNRSAGVDEPSLAGGAEAMSYILDALRRAESERDRGQVPGLNAQPAPGPTTATPTRPTAVVPVLALGLGLLLLAALAWWAWPRGTVPTPGLLPANGGAAATAGVASAVPGAVVPVPAPAGTAPGPVATPESLPLPVVVSAPPPPPPPPPPLPSPRGPPAPSPAPSPALSTPAPEPSSGPRTVRLADMTAQQRRDWPPLTLGGAVHSDNPASRFIIVNGQLVREGEEAAPGVTVERIDARAAVLRWRDLRVELPF